MPDLETISPSLSSSVAQSGVADLAGGIAYSGVADADDAGDVAFGGPTADFILYGVVNGAFSQGPADSTQNIEPVNNPLPYWTGPTQVSGGAITASWVEDSDSPSGYNLRFTINPGAAGDEAYFEQIVPVSGDRYRAFGVYIRAAFYPVAISGGTPQATVACQFLTASGATTGSTFSSTGNLSVGTMRYVGAEAGAAPPADASFLRVRCGIKRNSMATSDTATVDLANVRADRAGAIVLVPEQSSPGSYAAGWIYQGNGSLLLYSGPDKSTTFAQIDGTTGDISLFANANINLKGAAGALALEVDAAKVQVQAIPLQIGEQAAPGTPPSGYGALYVDTSGRLHFINDAGTDTTITP